MLNRKRAAEHPPLFCYVRIATWHFSVVFQSFSFFSKNLFIFASSARVDVGESLEQLRYTQHRHEAKLYSRHPVYGRYLLFFYPDISVIYFPIPLIHM